MIKRLLTLIMLICAFTVIAKAQSGTPRFVDNTTSGCSTPSDNDYDPITEACGSGSSIVYNTINGAFGVTTAGDSVLIRAGTYAEFVRTTNLAGPATATNRILVQAYNGENVVIRTPGGSSNLSVVRTGPSGVYVTWDGIDFDGINIDVADQNFGQVFAISGDGNGIIVKNSIVRNGLRSSGIFIQGDGIQILDSQFFDNGRDINYLPGANGIYAGNMRNSIIRGNKAYRNACTGIRVYASNGAQANNNIIERNDVYQNGGSHGPLGVCTSISSGFTIGDQNNIVQYNYAYENDGQGFLIWKGGGTSANNIFRQNVSINNVGYGARINLSSITGTQFINNFFVGNTVGAFLNNGTGTVFTTNRTTGAVTDCLVSSSNLTLKSGSNPCVDAGTVIAGVPSNGAPDQGTHERATASTGSMTGNTADVPINMALWTPLRLGASPTAGWSITVGSARTVTGVTLLGSNTAQLTFDGAACGGGDSGSVSYSDSTGTMTDSIFVGKTVNQKIGSFGPITLTNLCTGGGGHTITGTAGDVFAALLPQATSTPINSVSAGGLAAVRTKMKVTGANPPTGLTTKFQCSLDDTNWADVPDTASGAGNCPFIEFVGLGAFTGMDGHHSTNLGERLASEFGTDIGGEVIRCFTGCQAPARAFVQNSEGEMVWIVRFTTPTVGNTYYFREVIAADGTAFGAYTAKPSIKIIAPSASGFAELWDLLMLTFLPALGRIEAQTTKPSSNFVVGFPNVDQVTLEGQDCTSVRTTGSGMKRVITCLH